MNAKLNKRERRAQALLAHYATCERLARLLGAENPDGKKISVVLWKAERAGQKSAERLCDDPYYTQTQIRHDKDAIEADVCRAFHALPPGFFINSDPRGYALKIDNESEEGKALIEAAGLQKDWGGYGILSPDITGD